MWKGITGLLLMLCVGVAQALPEAAPTTEQEYLAWMEEVMASLDPQQGEVMLADGVARLQVPEDFVFLDATDAATVLEDVWGNPPDATVLGMILPADTTPFDPESWAVTVQYEQEGHISDADAGDIDYRQMLEEMQEAVRDENPARVEAGYEPLELVGWASPPRYDRQSRKLHWAKELHFGDMDTNTLNYNVRVLGREGMLLLNFIADMAQKPVIEEELDTVMGMASFNDGHRYEDFDPDVDEMAAYGIGALIAGKVASKAGILAAALVFLKKFGVLIVAGIGALFAKLFRRGEGN